MDDLISWLDSRGVRESSLQSNVDHLSDLISGGMEKRKEFLSVKFEAIERRVSRSHRPDESLDYRNVWA